MTTSTDTAQQQIQTGRRKMADLLAAPAATVSLLLVFYVALLVLFAVLSPFFLTFDNLTNIFSNMAFIGIMAALQTPLIISGGLDLSVAAVAGLAGVVVGLLNAQGINVWPAALMALGAGGAIGGVNALLVTQLKVNPFIATLGMMSIVEGGALVLTGGLTRPLMEPSFNFIGSGRILGVPVPALIMLIVFALVWWMLAHTRFGRYVFACGGNPEASRIAGVPVERTRTILYILSGASGALSGLVLAAMLSATAPTVASASLLTVIAAVILGGTSLFGGRGFVLGTLIAVLILGTLNNALVLLGVSSFWQKVTHGSVLLTAVGLDQLRTRAGGANT